MLACRQYDATQCDHSLFLDRVPDHNVGLPADLAIWDDVIRNVQVEVVDLISRHEPINLDRVPAFDSDRLKLILGYFNVAILADLVAHDDALSLDVFAGLCIAFAILDPVS